MMPSLSEIPFLDRYRAREKDIQQEGFNDLKQLGVLAQLQATMQAQARATQEVQRNEVLRQKIAAMPPEMRTRENILPLLLESGNVREIAPLLKDADKPTPIGSGGLRLPDGTIVPPVARPETARPQPIGSGGLRLPDGTIVPPVQRPEFKAPPSRTVVQGEEQIQQELQPDGTWKEVGRGPRFARQVPPVVIGSGAGKPPSGYRFTKEGELEAIPGGPADTKIQGALNQDTAALQGSTSALDRLAVATNELRNHPGLGRITGLMGALPNVPGSAGSNAAARLQTLKAQVGFSVLQDMRNASKTGGALGQITERELALLQNALAALDTAQDEESMKDSLDKILAFTESSKTRLREAYNMKHSGKGTAEPAADPLKAKVEASGIPYEPSVYEYREVGGKIQRRKK